MACLTQNRVIFLVGICVTLPGFNVHLHVTNKTHEREEFDGCTRTMFGRI